jgi:cytochrome P450
MQIAIMAARMSSRVRRWTLGVLLRFSGDEASDPGSLLARFPEQALMPLRRQGLDPVPELTRTRDQAPVSRLKMPFGLRGWLVTGYEESKTVLAAEHDTFSNDFGNMIGKVGIAAEQDPGGLGFADPPAHSRLRHMLTPTFTARALALRAPRIQQIIEETLDGLAVAGADGGVVDLQKHFAFPIPSRTIMELLGIDEADSAEFQRLSTARFDFAGGAVGSLDVIGESIGYLQEIVARQRVESGTGLIASILAEYGEDVGDVELAGLADGVLTGGLETTVSMLSLGSVLLMQDPAMVAGLGEDDAYVGPFVEELLRYLTVVQVGFPRFARKDMTLGGRTILAGDIVVCSLVAANRDPHHGGPTMERIEAARAGGGHLAFGHGIHRCVGAELARLELRMAYPALVRRFPDLRLAVDPDQLPYRQLSLIYGLQSLPVYLGRRAG